MAAAYKSLFLQVSVDGAKALEGIERIDVGLQKTRSELKELKSSLKLEFDAEKFQRAQELARKAVEESTNKVKLLRQAVEECDKQGIDKTTDEFRALQTELDKAENTAKRLIKQFVEINSMNLDRLASQLDSAEKKLTSMGKSILPVSMALSAGLVYGTKAAIDYEQAFVGVKKTVDATDAQLRQLNSDIRQMALETPTAAKELADIASTAGQLGIRVENIKGFTKTIADLGAASNLAGEEGASMLAKFANITQMPQEKFDRLGSTIVALGNNAATNEKSIAEMSLRLAGAGAQARMSEADILAMSTALSSVGIEAEAGGSAFSKLFNNVNLAVQTNSEKLTQYAAVAGKTAAEFKRAFEEDAAGAIMSFIEGLGNAGSAAILVLEEMEITEVRSRDALLRAAGAGDMFRESLQLANAAWEENTALAIEAERAYSSTANQIQLTKNAIDDAAIDIGNMLLPVLKDVILGVKDAAEWFTNLDEQTQKSIITMLGLAAALSPVLLVTGQITGAASGVVKGISGAKKSIDAFKAANDAATVSQATLNAVMNANPYVLIGSALAVVTAAVVGYALVTRDTTDATRKQIKANEELRKSYDGVTEAADKKLQESNAELDNIQRLKNELDDLSIKENKSSDDKARMKFIIEEINKVLPNSVTLINDETVAYDNQAGSIDNLIAKKRTLILLENKEEKYKEAVKGIGGAEYNRDYYSAQVAALEEAKPSIPQNARSIGMATAMQMDSIERQLIQSKEGLIKATQDYETYSAAIKDYEDTYAKYLQEFSTSPSADGTLTSGGIPEGLSTKSSKSSAGKSEANKAAEDTRKKELDDLKWAYDMGYISEEEYYNRLAQLRDDYFNIGSSEWQKYTLEIKNYIEKTRQAAVKEFTDMISEAERQDKRWNDTLKARGELTINDEDYVLSQRIERYRQYAVDVLAMEGISYEERLKLSREYEEKAADIDLELFKLRKNLQEEAEKLAKKEFEDQMKEIEDYKKLKLESISSGLEREMEAIKNRTDYAIGEIDREYAASQKLLQAKLDGIDAEIEARRRLREDEATDEKIAKIQKQIEATQALIKYERDEENLISLTRQLERQQEELEKAKQDRDDTEFYRLKEDEKDAVRREMTMLQEQTEAAKENARLKQEMEISSAQSAAMEKSHISAQEALAQMQVLDNRYFNYGGATNNYDNSTQKLVIQGGTVTQAALVNAMNILKNRK